MPFATSGFIITPKQGVCETGDSPVCETGDRPISLFDPAGRQFVWPAVSGVWAPHVGGTMPRDFSPCGTVLDRDQALLFRRPERHFAYVAEIFPPIEEGLLVPFHIENQPMGTIWAIHLDAERFFDAEDERLLTNLSKITAAAHRTLTDVGALTLGE